MTLAQLKTALESITGFSKKVAYNAFPVGEAPSLPFITFLQTGAETYSADGIVYHQNANVAIELYTEKKSSTTESLVETALTTANLYFTKDEQYLDDERCYFVVYQVTL